MIVVSRLSASSYHACMSLAAAALTALSCAMAGCNPLGLHMSEQRLVGSGEYDVIRGLVVPETAGAAGCGAQALACLMHHADPSCDAQEVCDGLPFHQSGANAIHVLLAARAHGFLAEAAMPESPRERPAPVVDWSESAFVNKSSYPLI